MLLPDAHRLAVTLMKQHKLDAWSFRFNRRKRSVGLCQYTSRTIELSAGYVALNGEAEVSETILHEIAHALVGPEHGHGAAWKARAVALGARPARCAGPEVATPAGRWRAACPACARQFHRHRRPRGGATYWCAACGRERGVLKYCERYAIQT